MNAAVYCRVSTEGQEQDGTSLDSQQHFCLKTAVDLGYTVPEDLIFRESCSGLSLWRPLLTVLREKIKAGDIAAVIVYSPDRLSRVGEEILVLFKEFKLAGAKLICVNNQFEDSLTGKVIAFMLGWASELEASQIRERTMRGKRTLASRGFLAQGTGAGIYGYDWVKADKKLNQSGRRSINEYESKIVDKIFSMMAEGRSRFDIARTLNENGVPTKSKKAWHPLTIERIVTNTSYIGKTIFGKTQRNGKKTILQPEEKWLVLTETTPAIISQELFDRAQKMLAKGKELHRGRPQHEYLLTGFMKCGYCGEPLIGTFLSHHYRYYHCRGTYPTSTRDAICKAHYLPADEIESVVWTKVKEVIEHPEVILADSRRRMQAQDNGEDVKVQKQIAVLQTKMSKYQAQEERLAFLFRMGTIDEASVMKQAEKLKLEKQEDQEKLEQLTKVHGNMSSLDNVEAKIKERCELIKAKLKHCSYQVKRYALEALDVSILATDGQLEIKIAVPAEYTGIDNITITKYKLKTRKKKKELVAA